MKRVKNLISSRRPSKAYIFDAFIRFEILERLVTFQLTNSLVALIDDILNFAMAELLSSCLTDPMNPDSASFFVVCDKMYQPNFISKRNVKLLFLCLLRGVLVLDP